jgi:uncharacterized protein (TIGR00730 family)
MRHTARHLTVTVFCGARLGSDRRFVQATQALGEGLAEAGIRIAYGGGSVGLMGTLADAALAGGGTVVGIVPEFMVQSERLHPRITQVEITDSLHSRKRRMFEIADAFVSMPGGLGTLDETVEVITWRQLGLHDKPIILCNIIGSAEPVLAAIEASVSRGFAPPEVRAIYEVLDGVPAVLQRLAHLHRVARGEATRL